MTAEECEKKQSTLFNEPKFFFSMAIADQHIPHWQYEKSIQMGAGKAFGHNLIPLFRITQLSHWCLLMLQWQTARTVNYWGCPFSLRGRVSCLRHWRIKSYWQIRAFVRLAAMFEGTFLDLRQIKYGSHLKKKNLLVDFPTLDKAGVLTRLISGETGFEKISK